MNERNVIADELKGLAVLLMIQVHIMELFADKNILHSSFGKLVLFFGGAPVAPLFAILLGYFISQTKPLSKKLMIRGLQLMALGLALNVALNFNLLLSVYNQKIKQDVLPYIFGVDFLLFAALSCLVIALLQYVFEKHLWILCVCIFLFAFFGNFEIDTLPDHKAVSYILAFFYGCTHWSYFPLCPWLAYVLVGMLIFKLHYRFNINWVLPLKFKLLIAILFLLFALFTIPYAINITNNLPLYYHHGLAFFIWTILFLFFYSFFINEAYQLIGNSLVFKYVKWLGKNVTLIYVIQWIIIGNLATEVYKTATHPLYLMTYVVLIIVLSSGITYFLLKIKNRTKIEN